LICAGADLQAVVAPLNRPPVRDRFLFSRHSPQDAAIMEVSEPPLAASNMNPRSDDEMGALWFQVDVRAVKCRTIFAVAPAHGDNSIQIGFVSGVRSPPADYKSENECHQCDSEIRCESAHLEQSPRQRVILRW